MSRSLDDMLNGLKKETNSFDSKDNWAVNSINNQISALEDTSQVSDGAHTFDELYYHRMVLFAMICNQNSHEAWKSKKHHDGEMIEGMFIVGIDTPEGQFTYHYPKKYWKMFQVKKYILAPEFDGHTSKDITRLFSLLK